MARRTWTGAVLVALILLSGCGSFADTGGSQDATSTPTATSTETATKTEYWSPPMPPNTPTETVAGESNRIESVKFVNKEAVQSGGYSNFDLQITADTRMENSDADEKVVGDVTGEPYFLVVLNGKSVERAEYLDHKQGTFDVTIRKQSLDQVEPGTLEVKVYLLDRDGQRDDLFGTWSGTIEYAQK